MNDFKRIDVGCVETCELHGHSQCKLAVCADDLDPGVSVFTLRDLEANVFDEISLHKI